MLTAERFVRDSTDHDEPDEQDELQRAEQASEADLDFSIEEVAFARSPIVFENGLWFVHDAVQQAHVNDVASDDPSEHEYAECHVCCAIVLRILEQLCELCGKQGQSTCS